MIPAAALLLLAVAPTAQSLARCNVETVEPEREFAGIYIDEFEGQRFFEGGRALGDIDRRAPGRTWLEVDVVGLGTPFGIDSRAPGLAYRIRFTGVRRSRGDDRRIPCGYGHMNQSAAEIRVVRLLAIERLGPGPR